jgi:hypothetical protein
MKFKNFNELFSFTSSNIEEFCRILQRKLWNSFSPVHLPFPAVSSGIDVVSIVNPVEVIRLFPGISVTVLLVLFIPYLNLV